jgi:hypothetical protein
MPGRLGKLLDIGTERLTSALNKQYPMSGLSKLERQHDARWARPHNRNIRLQTRARGKRRRVDLHVSSGPTVGCSSARARCRQAKGAGDRVDQLVCACRREARP